jgi:hypothetical protein
MSDALVLNARSIAKREHKIGHPEVAAVVEELAAEVERLHALLRPFVDMVAEPEDFAAARRALEGTRHQPGT